MSDAPLQTLHQLQEALHDLLSRAHAGGIPREYLGSLSALADRIGQEAARAEEGDERRDEHRILFAAGKEVRVRHQEEQFAAHLIDLGAKGFGIESGRCLPVGDFIYVEVPVGGEMECFSCFVAFCRAKEGVGYRMGLRLFARLPRTSEDPDPHANHLFEDPSGDRG